MSGQPGVRVTVHAPAVLENASERTGSCQFFVESARPLPRAPYTGTVRIGGVERTATGAYPCRMLKHFSVAFASEADGGGMYAATVDLGDENTGTSAAYAAPGLGTRRPDEPIDVICKRIAGIFGRYCEEFRPPSVIVELGDR